MVVIRSAGLSTKQQQGFIHPVCTPLVDDDAGMKKFFYYYILLLLCGCFVSGLSPCRCVKQYRKSSPVYLKQWALSMGRGHAFYKCLSVVILLACLFSFQFSPAAWLKVCDTVLWSAGCLSVKASHDAGLDVLVGDLLVVVVRAAARWVHRWGRHGVEGEDELLSVAHTRRLGMVPRNTCGKVVYNVDYMVKCKVQWQLDILQ